MLRYWDLHENYQYALKLKLLLHFATQKSRISKLDKSISKLYLLNLDSLLPAIKPLYPDFGRPAKNQQSIIRSLVLMLDRQNYSITNWAPKVASDPFILTCADLKAQLLLLPVIMTFSLGYGKVLRNCTSGESLKTNVLPQNPRKSLRKTRKSLHENQAPLSVLLKKLWMANSEIFVLSESCRDF